MRLSVRTQSLASTSRKKRLPEGSIGRVTVFRLFTTATSAITVWKGAPKSEVDSRTNDWFSIGHERTTVFCTRTILRLGWELSAMIVNEGTLTVPKLSAESEVASRLGLIGLR